MMPVKCKGSGNPVKLAVQTVSDKSVSGGDTVEVYDVAPTVFAVA